MKVRTMEKQPAAATIKQRKKQYYEMKKGKENK